MMRMNAELFNHLQQDLELVSVKVCPTRLFVIGAARALKDSAPNWQGIILQDLASQIGCDHQELDFLVQERNLDSNINFPNFGDALIS